MSGVRRFIIISLLLASIVFAALFVSFNDDSVALWLLRDFSPRPLGWWMILAFVAGGFLGLLLSTGPLRRWRHARRLRRLRQRIASLEKENERLKQPSGVGALRQRGSE